MPTTESTISEQVSALKAGMATQAPAEILATFAAQQDELDAAGLPDAIASAGTPMPDAELLDVRGEATDLEATRQGRAAVVVFYRGAWCPFCNLTLRAYEQQLAPALASLDIPLIAISPQKPDGSLSIREANELTYAVLSDPGNQIAARLGVLTAPTDDVRGAQAALGLDVAAGNADGTDTVPMPTVVLVDADGVIRWIDVHPNYTTRTEPAAILDAIATRLG